jgi:steroid delta-isomerase-like uncharacterized protein
MTQAQDVVNRIWSTIESHDLSGIDQLLAADGEITMPGGMRVQGPAQVKQVLQAYVEAFPDLHHEIVDLVEAADGSKIAVELRVTGTQTGTMRGPGGDIPATGRQVTWESVDLITLEAGKVRTWHTYFDQFSFLAQLGLVPQAA